MPHCILLQNDRYDVRVCLLRLESHGGLGASPEVTSKYGLAHFVRGV